MLAADADQQPDQRRHRHVDLVPVAGQRQQRGRLPDPPQVGQRRTFAILANLPPDTNPAPSTMTYTDTGLTPRHALRLPHRVVQPGRLFGLRRRYDHDHGDRPDQPGRDHRGQRTIQLTWTGVGGADDLQRLPRHDAQRRRGHADRHRHHRPELHRLAAGLQHDLLLQGDRRSTRGGETPPVERGVGVLRRAADGRRASRSTTAPPSGRRCGRSPSPSPGRCSVRQSGPPSGVPAAARPDRQSTSVLTAAVSTDAQGRTVVTLTFSGTETDPVSGLNGMSATPSLADGRYQLTILRQPGVRHQRARLGRAGNGTAGSNYVSPTDTYRRHRPAPVSALRRRQRRRGRGRDRPRPVPLDVQRQPSARLYLCVPGRRQQRGGGRSGPRPVPLAV